MSTEALLAFVSKFAGSARFELRSTADNERVADWTVVDEGDELATAEAMMAEARGDAFGLRGEQRYVVLAIARGTGERLGRKPIVIPRVIADEEDGSRVDQRILNYSLEQQKHKDLILDGVLEQQQAQVKELASIVMKSQDKFVEAITLIEDLHSNKAERDLRVATLNAQTSQRQQLIDQVMPLLPVIANRALVAAKGKTTIGTAPLAHEIISSLLGSLSEEQMKAIMSALTPEQAAAMYEVYTAYAAEDLAKKEAAKEKAAQTNGVAAAVADVPKTEAPS